MNREKKIEDLREAEALEYELATRDLRSFIPGAWGILEPVTDLLWNWHHDLICEYLMAVYLGQIKRLIINVGPRTSKSIISTISFPDWVWTKKPETRFLFGSYTDSLATKHSIARRNLIESEWYQRGWGKEFSLAGDLNRKTEFANDKTGYMKALGIKGSVTGEGASCIVIDDPHNPKGAESDAERETIIQNYDLAWSTRLNNKKTGSIIIIMQRLHFQDLTGHLISKNLGFEHIKIPTIAEERSVIHFPISKREVIRQEKELLHPDRDGPEEIAQVRQDLGSYGFSGQHQQNPTPREGGIFKRSWWKFYRVPPVILRKIQFWDCAQKPGLSNDYSVCATWGEFETGYALLDIWRMKVSAPELEQATKSMFHKWLPERIVIEDKSAGSSLIQYLKLETNMPVFEFNPGKLDKETRAIAASPLAESGRLWLPEEASFVEDFIDEHEKFPNAAHDDQVDTTSMMASFFKDPKNRPFRAPVVYPR